jgi:ethanolamine utilization protein EutA
MPSPILIVMEQDISKALGQAIALEAPPNASILCIDRVRLKNGDYLDVGNPIGPALPVVVKTLILQQ